MAEEKSGPVTKTKDECPFLMAFDDRLTECVYLDGIYCDCLEVSPGNGDAWCLQQIEKGLGL